MSQILASNSDKMTQNKRSRHRIGKSTKKAEGRVTARQVAKMQGRVAKATSATRATREIAGVRAQEQQELV